MSLMVKQWLGLCLGAIASMTALATDFDYRLAPMRVAPDVLAFIGKTEDFTTSNGGNIVNCGVIEAPDGLIVIDTGSSKRFGEQMRAALGKASNKPVAYVINTHHHPDHFLGNQAYQRQPIGALAGARAGIARDGNAFAENLYRMTGDWMKGTEVVVPSETLTGGEKTLAGRRLRLIALDGHTGADLAIYDEASGVLFAGDLAFYQRAPTTPHADVGHWLKALDQLEAITREPGFRAIVPGHGPVTPDAAPIKQTRAWLNWLLGTLRQAAVDGLDMNDLLRRPLPPEFADLPLARSEFRRSVAHLFPGIEQEVLAHGR